MIWGHPIRYRPSIEPRIYVIGLLPECNLPLSFLIRNPLYIGTYVFRIAVVY